MSRIYFVVLFRVIAKQHSCGILNRARHRAVLLMGDANQIVHQLACLVTLGRIWERKIEPHANLRQARCAILVYAVAFYMHIKSFRLRAPGGYDVYVHFGTPRDGRQQVLLQR